MTRTSAHTPAPASTPNPRPNPATKSVPDSRPKSVTKPGAPLFRSLTAKGWGIERSSTSLLAIALTILSALTIQPATAAQATAPPTQSAPDQPATPPSSGTILFSRHLPTDPDATTPATPPPTPTPDEAAAQKLDTTLAVTDAEREALTFSAYDLDVHLTPVSAGIAVRAGLTLRNDSPAPLPRIVLQISSSLHWDALSTVASAASTPLPYTPHRVATDADHTGWMQEAVVTLPQPLAPGASLTLTALYSGTIPPSAERLERIGAPAAQALQSDWDAIAAGTTDTASSSSSENPDAPEAPGTATALRGFGQVLWYPVAAAPAFLGDGAKLFDAIGRAKLRSEAATIRLRLAVEYTGDPPDAAFFNGRREPLKSISDNPNVPVAESPGVATAVFEPRPLGFRTPNLFLAAHPPTPAGPATDETLLSAITDRFDALPGYAAAAAKVEPLLNEWFGPEPRTSLTLLDHPGQPFEDDALLIAPFSSEPAAQDPAALTASLAHSLTHAWVRSSHPWIDEGLAQFTTLLWTERRIGRPAALSQLQQLTSALALAEPSAPDPAATNTPTAPAASSSSSSQSPTEPAVTGDLPQGQSLIAATGELFYRSKAAAVWWMLRGITGDQPLQQALQAYGKDPTLDRDPAAFERALERTSHKDLHWFFNDWVYRDCGLPDLTIVNVTPRQLEARNGLPAGWLVAIEVRNDGYAVAEVPVTVRSLTGRGAATETERLRISGRTSVSLRIVFAGTPDEVQVNDGSVPEARVSIHTRRLTLPGA